MTLCNLADQFTKHSELDIKPQWKILQNISKHQLEEKACHKIKPIFLNGCTNADLPSEINIQG